MTEAELRQMVDTDDDVRRVADDHLASVEKKPGGGLVFRSLCGYDRVLSDISEADIAAEAERWKPADGDLVILKQTKRVLLEPELQFDAPGYEGDPWTLVGALREAHRTTPTRNGDLTDVKALVLRAIDADPAETAKRCRLGDNGFDLLTEIANMKEAARKTYPPGSLHDGARHLARNDWARGRTEKKGPTPADMVRKISAGIEEAGSVHLEADLIDRAILIAREDRKARRIGRGRTSDL